MIGSGKASRFGSAARRPKQQQPGNPDNETAGNDAQKQRQHQRIEQRRPCHRHEQAKACQAERDERG